MELTEEDKTLIEEYRRNELSKYPKPSVTADIVAVRPAFNEVGDGNWRRNPVFGMELLLIQRRQWPFRDCWALPGGFCREDESVEACANREFKEETGLNTGYLIPVGVFSEPGRDPRSWVISNAFVSVMGRGEGDNVQGGDDAKCACWFKIDNPVMCAGYFRIPMTNGSDTRFDIIGTYQSTEFDGGIVTSVEDSPLAFDHSRIIAQAFLRMLSYDPRRLTLFFLPEKFSLSEYIGIYQYLTKYSIDQKNMANFRRQLTSTGNSLLEPCDGADDWEPQGRGHKLAKLYRRRGSAKLF